jgi:1-acyl-sn-glycerol-3-phosphate acyltransferase
VLRRGDLVGIFPEGGLGDGVTLQPGHSGVARLALQAGVPVVPMAVWGTNRRWPRSGVRFGRPIRPRASVVVGPPIQPSGDPASPQDMRRLTDEVMAAIAAALAIARSES